MIQATSLTSMLAGDLPGREPAAQQKEHTSMNTACQRHVTFASVLKLIANFVDTIDQLEIDRDELELDAQDLHHALFERDYFYEDYVTSLGNLRNLAGECLAKACQEAKIGGFHHWSEGSTESLSECVQRFHRDLAAFLRLMSSQADLFLDLEGEWPDEDLELLSTLKTNLALPLMRSLAYLRGNAAAATG